MAGPGGPADRSRSRQAAPSRRMLSALRQCPAAVWAGTEAFLHHGQARHHTGRRWRQWRPGRLGVAELVERNCHFRAIRFARHRRGRGRRLRRRCSQWLRHRGWQCRCGRQCGRSQPGAHQRRGLRHPGPAPFDRRRHLCLGDRRQWRQWRNRGVRDWRGRRQRREWRKWRDCQCHHSGLGRLFQPGRRSGRPGSVQRRRRRARCGCGWNCRRRGRRRICRRRRWRHPDPGQRRNTGIIRTSGAFAHGALVQSVGGAGGNGGNASFIAQGGAGAAGGNGGAAVVQVPNASVIATGKGAIAMVAQSVGGGGGWAAIPTISRSAPQIAIGGNGGLGGNGGSSAWT